MSSTKRASKFLSLILRHKPEEAGITLDTEGWADVRALLTGCKSKGYAITLGELKQVVAENDKQRFIFSEDGKRIRATQGHSVEVDLGYAVQVPPTSLFHGTATKNLDSIKAQGLLKGSRQHVHLSTSVATATQVGQRYGTPVILLVNAKKMHEDGKEFFLTPNGVWLTDAVEAKYIKFEEIQY